jgi:shikimate dehydrogenase
MSEMKLLGVIGKPVYHSRSPIIFDIVFRELGIDALYLRLSAETAREAMETVKEIKLSGFNVTSPFKEGLVPLLDSVDEPAAAIGAVNCVVSQDTKYRGRNTDFLGAVEALERNGVSLRNKRVAIFGAGGAARAAAYGLKLAGTNRVTLINRTLDKARIAARRLGCDYAPFEEAPKVLGQSDILISCISSRRSVINPDHLRKGLVVMDANYRPSELARAAGQKDCVVIDGLEWLLCQAFHSLREFIGQEVTPALRGKIGKAVKGAAVSPKTNIALVGFMGSGKTTVGRLLAEKWGSEFVDTDEVIGKNHRMTVSEIFKLNGEGFFRAEEKSVVKTLLPHVKRTVISLGGGAILDEDNQRLIKQNCHSVWLWTSPSTALKRIASFSRPLLRGHDAKKRAEALLESRLPFYAKVSDLVLSTESANGVEIARRILNEMD